LEFAVAAVEIDQLVVNDERCQQTGRREFTVG